jgi:hypothetical protein
MTGKSWFLIIRTVCLIIINTLSLIFRQYRILRAVERIIDCTLQVAENSAGVSFDPCCAFSLTLEIWEINMLEGRKIDNRIESFISGFPMPIEEPIITEERLQMPASESLLNVLPNFQHIIPSRADEVLLNKIMIVVLESSNLNDLFMLRSSPLFPLLRLVVHTHHDLAVDHLVLGFPGALLLLLLCEITVAVESWEVFAADVFGYVAALELDIEHIAKDVLVFLGVAGGLALAFGTAQLNLS